MMNGIFFCKDDGSIRLNRNRRITVALIRYSEEYLETRRKSREAYLARAEQEEQKRKERAAEEVFYQNWLLRTGEKVTLDKLTRALDKAKAVYLKAKKGNTVSDEELLALSLKLRQARRSLGDFQYRTEAAAYQEMQCCNGEQSEPN